MGFQAILICTNVVIATAALSMLIAFHLLGTLSSKPFEKEIIYCYVQFVVTLTSLLLTV